MAGTRKIVLDIKTRQLVDEFIISQVNPLIEHLIVTRRKNELDSYNERQRVIRQEADQWEQEFI